MFSLSHARVVLIIFLSPYCKVLVRQHAQSAQRNNITADDKKQLEDLANLLEGSDINTENFHKVVKGKDEGQKKRADELTKNNKDDKGKKI